jgi:hypothetical protein
MVSCTLELWLRSKGLTLLTSNLSENVWFVLLRDCPEVLCLSILAADSHKRLPRLPLRAQLGLLL